jgi:hypothetical protein
MKWILGYPAIRCIAGLALTAFLLVSGPLFRNSPEGLQSRMEINISLER